MYDPEGTWKRRGIYGALLMVVLILAGTVVYLAAFRGADNTATPTTGPAAASGSICGLPDGDQTVPTTAIPATWTDIDGMAVPTSADVGPGEESDGIHSCFARDPGGALFAGVMFLAERDDPNIADSARLVTDRSVPGPTRDQALASLSDGEVADEGPSFQVAGYRYLSYDNDRASYELVVRLLRGPSVGTMVSIVTNLQWQDGDWKNVFDQDLQPAVSNVDSLEGRYVSWDSTQSLSPSANRPPLAWALKAAVATPNAPEVTPAPTEESSDSGCSVLKPWKCVVNPVDAVQEGVGDAVGEVAGSVAGSAFDQIAQQAQEAAEWAMTNLLTAWLKYPDPDVQASDSVTAWLDSNLSGLVIFVMIGSVMVSAMRLMLTGQFEHIREMGALMGRVVLTAGLVGVLVGLGLEIGDLFSQWIIEQADVELGAGLLSFAFTTNPFLILLIALLVVVTQIIQLGLMVVRGALVGILAGALPLMAAASNSSTGKQSFQKTVAWLTAFVLYKPVAAIIYASAFKLVDSRQDIATQLSGVFVMVLAVFALPAMMRLIVPVTGNLGGANAGALAGATVGAALATGAVVASGGLAAAGGAMSAGGGAMTTGGGVAGAAGATGAGSAGAAGGGSAGSPPPMTPGAGPGGAKGETGGDGSLATTVDGASGSQTPAPGGAPDPGAGGSGAQGSGAGAPAGGPAGGAAASGSQGGTPGGQVASGLLQAGSNASRGAGETASGVVEGEELR